MFCIKVTSSLGDSAKLRYTSYKNIINALLKQIFFKTKRFLPILMYSVETVKSSTSETYVKIIKLRRRITDVMKKITSLRKCEKLRA